MGTKTREKVFIDPETGEYVSGDQIFQTILSEERPAERFDWLKLFPKFLTRLKGVVRSPRFDVVLFLFGKMKYGTNEFCCSQNEAAIGSEAGLATVKRVFEELQREDLIRCVTGSLWMVSPRLIHGGNQVMDRVLYDKYEKLFPSSRAGKKNEETKDKTVQSSLDKQISKLIEGVVENDDD